MLLQRSPPGSATPGPSARMRFHEAEETPAFTAAVASPPFCAMQLPAQINTTKNTLASISHSPVSGLYRIALEHCHPERSKGPWCSLAAALQPPPKTQKAQPVGRAFFF